MSGNDAVKTLAAKAHGLRECSVLLYRLEQIGHRPQLELKDDAKRVFGIKIEADCEEVVVKQELDAEHVVKPDPDVPEVDGFVLKMKQEMDEVIKQELDIGPTVLQSRAAIVAGPDPRPSTSFVIGASSAPLCTKMAGSYAVVPSAAKVLRECSVLLQRLESICHRHQLQSKYYEERVLGIKMEDDCGDAVVKHELDTEYTPLRWEIMAKPDLHVTEKTELVVKAKDEMDDVTIKQELDIEPTMLQLQITPCALPPLTLAGPDQRPSGGCGSEASSAAPYTILARPASRTESEDDNHKGNSGVQSNKVFQTILSEDSCHNSDSKDESMGTQVGEQKSYCVMSMTECNIKIEVSKSKPEPHTGGKQYECDYNKHNTARKCMPKNHIHGLIVEKRYKCERCTYSASCLNSLKIHMRTHTGDKPYKCGQCEYRASQLSHLKMHMRTHTSDKPYKCDQCEFCTSRLGSLKSHIRIHTGEKPHKCENCEFSASRIDSLKIHMRIHTGERPYKCKQCEYSSSCLGNLKKHMRTHTGEKPYKCGQCGYSTSQLCHLKMHMRTHTSDKLYKCEQCEFCTSRLGGLKSHIRIHTVKNCINVNSVSTVHLK